MSAVYRPTFLRAAAWVGPAMLTDVVTIVGCGATGSYIAVALAKMGFTQFCIYDSDLVEPHNLPNQEYDSRHVGMLKVDALELKLMEFNPDITVTKNNEFFTSDTVISDFGPVILTTDTNSSRVEIMNVCKGNLMVDHVFETRLGFHHGEVAIVDNHDSESVEKWLNTVKPDDEIPDGPCNERTCTTLVMMIAAFTVHQICEKYSAATKDERWIYNKRTLIQMNPSLTVLSM